MPTEEFELLKNDPDLQSELGPGGTLIFLDGDAYCVVGPEFVILDESDCYAFGETREQAIRKLRRSKTRFGVTSAKAKWNSINGRPTV
jgi:hypothetical protein